MSGTICERGRSQTSLIYYAIQCWTSRRFRVGSGRALRLALSVAFCVFRRFTFFLPAREWPRRVFVKVEPSLYIYNIIYLIYIRASCSWFSGDFSIAQNPLFLTTCNDPHLLLHGLYTQYYQFLWEGLLSLIRYPLYLNNFTFKATVWLLRSTWRIQTRKSGVNAQRRSIGRLGRFRQRKSRTRTEAKMEIQWSIKAQGARRTWRIRKQMDQL